MNAIHKVYEDWHEYRGCDLQKPGTTAICLIGVSVIKYIEETLGIEATDEN